MFLVFSVEKGDGIMTQKETHIEHNSTEGGFLTYKYLEGLKQRLKTMVKYKIIIRKKFSSSSNSVKKLKRHFFSRGDILTVSFFRLIQFRVVDVY